MTLHDGFRRLALPDARPVRFVLVGVTGVGVNMLVIWMGTAGLHLHTTAAGVLAAVVSTFTNFTLNSIFTWRDRRSAALRLQAARLVRYYVTTGGGNVVYLGVLTMLVHTLEVRLALANLVAIAVGGAFNYLLHNAWTWRRGEPA